MLEFVNKRHFEDYSIIILKRKYEEIVGVFLTSEELPEIYIKENIYINDKYPGYEIREIKNKNFKKRD
ncbi:hypothetical protein KQI41_12215 [Tissierella pigra]|uniref:hypothetical protein n=1 Tax=Tissierella pigra TaxID=2607614 RepID=UPI001C109AE9|nr:hypothetical protein [Tissierella pigra]MBU5427181.1 hypothetical protein [Tissierella pigra]